MAPAYRLSRVLLVAAVGVSTALVLPATSGSATPTKSIQDVQREVDQLSAQADIAIERYDQARIELSAAARKTKAAEDRVSRAQQKIAAQRSVMGQIAADAYRSGSLDEFVSLMSTSSPENFLGRAAALDQISSHESSVLESMRIAQLGLSQAQAVARQQLAAQKKIATQLKEQKAAIQDTLARQQSLLDHLKAEERARLAALERQRQQEIASTTASRAAPIPTYNGPASGRAAVAVKFAYAQLGKPYSWGASGPSSYDCSGLTMAAWGSAGVSLPHSSAAQYGSGPHVSQENVEPGDLVFFGSPIHHVGIYIGNGNMINAPHTGDVVKIEAAFRSDYVGAVRP